MTTRSPDDRIEARIAQIERLMSDRHSEYYRGPKAEALQTEYRALLEERASVSHGSPGDRARLRIRARCRADGGSPGEVFA